MRRATASVPPRMAPEEQNRKLAELSEEKKDIETFICNITTGLEYKTSFDDHYKKRGRENKVITQAHTHRNTDPFTHFLSLNFHKTRILELMLSGILSYKLCYLSISTLTHFSYHTKPKSL